MNGIDRIQLALQTPRERRIVIYLTVGYPELDITSALCEEIERSGASMIELGMPFSDPIADGPVIQSAGQCALNNGVTVGYILELVRTIRATISIPILLMGHLNPILRFGESGFYRQAADAGVDGLIIPDLPLEEFQGERETVFRKLGLGSVMLVTERTPRERVRLADRLSTGFLYAVSRPGITGGGLKLDTARLSYLRELRELGLKNKILVGFGVKGRGEIEEIHRHADGVIIGSAFIEAIGDERGAILGAKRFSAEVMGADSVQIEN